MTPRRALLLIAGVALLCAVTMYAAGLRRVIRSDGAGYYEFLPAIFVEHSLSLNHGIALDDGHVPDWFRTDEATGNHYDKFPVGVAILLLPFFLVAHALTLVTGGVADGFSPLYQCAVALAGLFYGLLGLLFLRRILEKTLPPQTVAFTLIVMTFGTNLFHYLTFDATFSHAYSFFLCAVFVWLTMRWSEAPSLRTDLLIGLTAGAIVLVRPTNAIILLYLPLCVFESFAALKKAWIRLLVIVLTALVTLIPQFAYWKLSTGHYFVYSYGNEHFDFASPHALLVLFSIKKGLFFWSPVLLFSMAGLYAMMRTQSAELRAIIIVLALQLAIVSSWWCWWYGGSFGHRAFTEYVVFFAIGFAALLKQTKHLKAVRVASLVATGFSVLAMALYWAHVIPYEGF